MAEIFSGYTDAAMYYGLISTGTPEDDPGHLATWQYLAIVAFLLRENGFPAGDIELTPDRELPGQIILTGIAQIWNETAIVVITEFGRTAQGNGTDGTDHGTGTVAFVLRGAVAGGRVIADWPGLGVDQLLDAP